MKRFFRKYWPFARATYESFLEYRGRMILWILGELLSIAILFFLWSAIYESSGKTTINNFTLSEMLFYSILSTVVQYATYINPHWLIANEIQSGNLAMSLIKPINYQIRLFFHGIGEIFISFSLFLFPLVLIIIPSLLVFQVQLDITISLINIGYFLISIVLAVLINFFISFLFGTIIFFTINSFGIWQLKEAIELIFSGSLIPLVFFPSWLYQIAIWLPFAQGRYFPVLLLLGKTPLSGPMTLAIQGMWLVGLFLISQLMWRLATRRIVIQGG